MFLKKGVQTRVRKDGLTETHGYLNFDCLISESIRSVGGAVDDAVGSDIMIIIA